MSEMSGTVTEWLKPNQPLALWWQQYYPGLRQVSRDLAARVSAARATDHDSSPQDLTLSTSPGIPVDTAGLRYYDYGLLGGAIDYRMRMEFTHQWGGAIDTCARFCAFYGTAHRGRVAYATGFTGLGVGATRFGAQVMLDLLSGAETERTRLAMVREKPVPFPPEPLAYTGIQLTRWALASADRHEGRRNLWLKALDRAGLGFDS